MSRSCEMPKTRNTAARIIARKRSRKLNPTIQRNISQYLLLAWSFSNTVLVPNHSAAPAMDLTGFRKPVRSAQKSSIHPARGRTARQNRHVIIHHERRDEYPTRPGLTHIGQPDYP